MSMRTAVSVGATTDLADRKGKHVGEGYWAGALRRLLANKVATVSAIFIILIAMTAIILPEVYPRSYADQNYAAITQTPSWRYPMGTDQLGRDIFIRLIFGARISLTVGLVVQGVILLIGVPAGLVSGYFGGKIDTIIMRIVDVLYAMPSLLFIIILMTFLRGTLDSNPDGFWGVIARADAKTGGLVGVYLGLGLIGWLTVSRIVRANTMSLKQREFTEAARSIGAPGGRIMFRHILPNTIAPIVVATTLGIPSAILAEAGISFLGIGVIPPMPSWGLMISDATLQMRVHPYMLVFPAMALSLTVLSFNFLGDGLRDALDPWMRR